MMKTKTKQTSQRWVSPFLSYELWKQQIQTAPKFAFGIDFKTNFFLLFSLFLLLFIGPIALFGTIHVSHYTISATFELYL